MDAERIERLAIDRALGELNEDAAALLDAYLAEHPEMRTWARDMEGICLRTKAALGNRAGERIAGEPDVRSTWPRSIGWLTLLRWAAVVVLSVGLGATVGQWSRRGIEPSEVTIARAGTTGNSGSRRDILDGQGEGFWQSKALALLQTASYAPADSRDTQTSLWGRYRQLRKERSYE